MRNKGFPWQLFRVWLRREIKSRYAGSLAGALWAIVAPLFTVALFYVLFAFIFKVRVPEIASQAGYFYYLLSGILPWLGISDGLSRATGVIVGHEQFLQKQAFPVEILPLTAVTGALIAQLVGTVVLIVLLIEAGLYTHRILWLFPLVLVAQVLLCLGLGFTLALFAVHFRDLLHAVPLALQFLFYATPILYQIAMVPEAYRGFFLLNPFAVLIGFYHAAFLGLPISGVQIAALVAWLILLAGGGLLLFRLFRPTLGDAA